MGGKWQKADQRMVAARMKQAVRSGHTGPANGPATKGCDCPPCRLRRLVAELERQHGPKNPGFELAVLQDGSIVMWHPRAGASLVPPDAGLDGNDAATEAAVKAHPDMMATMQYEKHRPSLKRQGQRQQPPPARKVSPVPARKGPGAHLKAILAGLGLKPAKDCGCDKRAAEMDAWGPAGCREHRAEIVAWLDEQRAKASWSEKLVAAAKAMTAGLPINLLDPMGSLVDEAIRRAEVA